MVDKIKTFRFKTRMQKQRLSYDNFISLKINSTGLAYVSSSNLLAKKLPLENHKDCMQSFQPKLNLRSKISILQTTIDNWLLVVFFPVNRREIQIVEKSIYLCIAINFYKTTHKALNTYQRMWYFSGNHIKILQ